MDRSEGLPIPSHVGPMFLLWLWWKAETGNGYYNFKADESEDDVDIDTLASIDLWVDERIALRNPDETKVVTVLTGENPSAAPESKVALSAGKVIHELRLGIRRDDREFYFTLKGPSLSLHNAKLPQIITESSGTEVALDRLALLIELEWVISLLFNDYAHERLSKDWRTDTAKTIVEWMNQR